MSEVLRFAGCRRVRSGACRYFPACVGCRLQVTDVA